MAGPAAIYQGKLYGARVYQALLRVASNHVAVPRTVPVLAGLTASARDRTRAISFDPPTRRRTSPGTRLAEPQSGRGAWLQDQARR